MKKFVLLLLALAFVSSLTYAQLKTADIYGTVTTTDGSAIPGVAVTLTGDVVGTMNTVSSAEGNFRFIKLSPGNYELRFELEGFKTVVRKGIRLTVGQNLTLSIPMETTVVKEEIVVVGKAGVVDTRKTNVGINVTKEAIQALPTARNPWTLIALTPGMMMDRQDVGGAESGQQSNMYGHGTDRFDTTWNVDGANTTDQAALGGAAGYLNVNGFEEMQVSIGANDITAQTGGTQINFVTKRGGNRYGGDLYMYVEDKSWEFSPKLTDDMKKNNVKVPGINRLYQYGVNFGGPIIKDHFWFFGSWGIQDIHTRSESGSEDVSWLQSGYIKANLQWQKLSGSYTFMDNSKKKWGRPSIGATQQSDSSLWNQTGPTRSHNVVLGYQISNLTLEARHMHVGGGFNLHPKGNTYDYGKGIEQGLEYYYYYYPQVYLNGGGNWYDNMRPTDDWSLEGNLFVEKALGGDHEIRFGVDYYKSANTTLSAYPFKRRLFMYSNFGDMDPSLADIATDVVSAVPNNVTDLRTRKLAFFAQDTITFKRFSINLGLRYDIEQGLGGALNVPAWDLNGVLPAKIAPYLGEKIIPAYDGPFKWKTFSPRLSITYDITGKGKTVAKISAARYGSAGGINLATYATQGMQGFRSMNFPWHDANGDGVPQANEVEFLTPTEMADRIAENEGWANFIGFGGFNPANPLGAVSSSQFDPDFSAPLTDELVLSLEHELVENLAVSISGFYRKLHNGVWFKRYWTEANGSTTIESAAQWKRYTDASGNTVDPVTKTEQWITTRRNHNGVYYTNYKDSYNEYKAVQLLLVKRLSNKWMAQASLNLMSNNAKLNKDESFNRGYAGGGNPGTGWTNYDYFNGGAVAPQSGGSGLTGVFVNSTWQAKFNGMYQLPYGINVSAVFSAQQGYVIQQHAHVWNGTNMFAADKQIGDDRLPTLWTLSLGLEKTFKISEGTTAAITVDGYNITNNNTVLKVVTTLGKDNGLPLKILNAGLFQIGFRLNF